MPCELHQQRRLSRRPLCELSYWRRPRFLCQVGYGWSFIPALAGRAAQRGALRLGVPAAGGSDFPCRPRLFLNLTHKTCPARRRYRSRYRMVCRVQAGRRVRLIPYICRLRVMFRVEYGVGGWAVPRRRGLSPSWRGLSPQRGMPGDSPSFEFVPERGPAIAVNFPCQMVAKAHRQPVHRRVIVIQPRLRP